MTLLQEKGQQIIYTIAICPYPTEEFFIATFKKLTHINTLSDLLGTESSEQYYEGLENFNTFLVKLQLLRLNRKLWFANKKIIIETYFKALKIWGEYLAHLKYRAFIYLLFIFEWFQLIFTSFHPSHHPRKTTAPPIFSYVL